MEWRFLLIVRPFELILWCVQVLLESFLNVASRLNFFLNNIPKMLKVGFCRDCYFVFNVKQHSTLAAVRK